VDQGIKGKILHDYLSAFKIIQNFLIENEYYSESNVNTIHYFLGQLMAFGCIYFSNFSHQIEKKDKKKAIFFQFFKNKINGNEYKFDMTVIQKLLHNVKELSSENLPNMFQNNEESKNFSKWRFNKKQVELLYNNLWDSKEFYLIETLDEKLDEKDIENIIHPGIIGEIYENVQHIEQKKKVQKGVFYTPLSEIKFSVLMAINNHFMVNHPNISKSDKDELIDIITRIFKNQDNFSEREIEHFFKFLNFYQNLRILDPACGSGSFLYQILNFFLIIFKNYNIDEKLKQFPSIFGVDVNKWAVKLAQFRLWALVSTNLIEKSEEIRNIYHSGIKIMYGDFILENKQLDINNEGFDIIIGNPPYIRHRDIFNLQDNSPQANIIYRNQLHSSLNSIPNIVETEKSRLDYYMYFFYHGLNKLRPNGILAYIVSNSWMNVKYGYNFQEYVCRYFKIKQIYDSIYRSFQKAQVNTVIAIFHKSIENIDKKNAVKFIKWKNPYSELLNQKEINSIMKKIYEIKSYIQPKTSTFDFKIVENEIFREFSCSQNFVYNLKNENYNDDRSKINYVGYNWANYFFNAPSFYFELMKKCGKEIVYLRDIATVQRGLTTNCNDFFIVTKIDKDIYINGYGDKIKLDPEFLLPIISSPRQLSKPYFDPDILNTKLFYCNKSKNDLEKGKFLKTLEYIRYGEKKKIKVKKGAKRGEFVTGIQNLASFIEKDKNKTKNWYSLTSNLLNSKNIDLKSPIIIFQKIFNTTYKMGFSDKKFLPNNTFYKISLKKEYLGQERLVFSLLLSAFSMISIELQGRTNFGGGALDTATFNIEEIILIDPLILTKENIYTINQLATPLMNKNFKSSKIEFQDKNRRKFDEVILKLLPVSLDIETLYQAIINIQNIRISRSKTFDL
jgi:methylase of polypeptide subunit release factors